MNVEMPSESQKLLKEFCDPRGFKQRYVVAKVLQWFVGQPPNVQRLVMGDLSGVEGAIADELERIAKELRKGTTGSALPGQAESPKPAKPRIAARSIGRRRGEAPGDQDGTQA